MIEKTIYWAERANMTAWNTGLYLQFCNERTQPAIDLIARMNIADPKNMIDLGCGPGNSTEMLKLRWPSATVAGLDSSPEMIASAKQRYPEQKWLLGDLATWCDGAFYDVVFSNAALHWIPDHAGLVPRLMSQVAPGGALAFQIPTSSKSALQPIILNAANEPEWRGQMAGADTVMTSESPAFYYDVLAGRASSVDIWETEYCHVMPDHAAILNWISSTRLRPFLDRLDSPAQQTRFTALITEGLHATYPVQRNGKVLFPFRRLFVIAYR